MPLPAASTESLRNSPSISIGRHPDRRGVYRHHAELFVPRDIERIFAWRHARLNEIFDGAGTPGGPEFGEPAP